MLALSICLLACVQHRSAHSAHTCGLLCPPSLGSAHVEAETRGHAHAHAQACPHTHTRRSPGQAITWGTHTPCWGKMAPIRPPMIGGEGHHLPMTSPVWSEYCVPHCGSWRVCACSLILPPNISVPVAEFLAEIAHTLPLL